MRNLNLKKNQVVIFVVALMLVTAGYLNFTNQQNTRQNMIPTSSLADSEQMAAIGDATLVSANQTTESNNQVNTKDENNAKNVGQSNIQDSNTTKSTNSSEINQQGSNEKTNVEANQPNNSNAQKNLQTTNSNNWDSTYFTQSRLDRDNMYSQMLENYQKILETDNLAADEKTNAQEEIKRINNEKNAIMIAENLIKTKGFEDVILFINNGNVSVITKADKLDESQIAQIQNIVTRELNVKTTKINVSVK